MTVKYYCLQYFSNQEFHYKFCKTVGNTRGWELCGSKAKYPRFPFVFLINYGFDHLVAAKHFSNWPNSKYY